MLSVCALQGSYRFLFMAILVDAVQWVIMVCVCVHVPSTGLCLDSSTPETEALPCLLMWLVYCCFYWQGQLRYI